MPCRPSRSGPLLAQAMLAAAALLAAGCDSGGKAGQPPAESKVRAERGKLLLAQYQCGSCHSIPGVASAGGQLSSSLAAFGQRSYIAGRHANRPELLAQWIAEPQVLVPGTLMPSMGVSPADARDMAAYLMALE